MSKLFVLTFLWLLTSPSLAHMYSEPSVSQINIITGAAPPASDSENSTNSIVNLEIPPVCDHPSIVALCDQTDNSHLLRQSFGAFIEQEDLPVLEIFKCYTIYGDLCADSPNRLVDINFPSSVEVDPEVVQLNMFVPTMCACSMYRPIPGELMVTAVGVADHIIFEFSQDVQIDAVMPDLHGVTVTIDTPFVATQMFHADTLAMLGSSVIAAHWQSRRHLSVEVPVVNNLVNGAVMRFHDNARFTINNFRDAVMNETSVVLDWTPATPAPTSEPTLAPTSQPTENTVTSEPSLAPSPAPTPRPTTVIEGVHSPVRGFASITFVLGVEGLTTSFFNETAYVRFLATLFNIAESNIKHLNTSTTTIDGPTPQNKHHTLSKFHAQATSYDFTLSSAVVNIPKDDISTVIAALNNVTSDNSINAFVASGAVRTTSVPRMRVQSVNTIFNVLDRVDCAVSAWGAYGQCSGTCSPSSGLAPSRTRYRNVTVAPLYGGAVCPALAESIPCADLQPCYKASLSNGQIAAVVIGCVIVFALLAALVVVAVRSCEPKPGKSQPQSKYQSEPNDKKESEKEKEVVHVRNIVLQEDDPGTGSTPNEATEEVEGNEVSIVPPAPDAEAVVFHVDSHHEFELV